VSSHPSFHYQIFSQLFALRLSTNYQLTKCIEQSNFWKANSFSASEGFPTFPILHPTALDASSCHEPDYSSLRSLLFFLKILFNTVLPSAPTPSKWFLCLRLLHQSSLCTSLIPHAFHMPNASHSSGFDQPHNSLWG